MAVLREIKNQVTNVQKIKKITRAMQNVAASKMQRTQQRMRASTAYAAKIREVMAHIAGSNRVVEHVYMQELKQIKKVGYIVIATDHGLCGGLNLNLFKMALEHAANLQQQEIQSVWGLLGKKAAIFFQNLAVKIIAQATDIGDIPTVANLLGSVKVMLDAYQTGELQKLFIVHNIFINTLVQKPQIEQLLPLVKNQEHSKYRISYLYEPTAHTLLEALMVRYIEMQVYQATVDNIACEQAARMLAMKNATDNSQEIINELRLMYNKERQANITRELVEVVGGAQAQSGVR